MNVDTSDAPALIYPRGEKFGAIVRGQDTGAQFNSYTQANDYVRKGALPIVAFLLEQCK